MCEARAALAVYPIQTCVVLSSELIYDILQHGSWYSTGEKKASTREEEYPSGMNTTYYEW